MNELILLSELPLMQLGNALLSPDLQSAQGIFCSLAWFATVFGGAFFLLTFIGVGFADMAGDTGHGSGGCFSLHAIIGFLLGLGWGGFICMEQGMSIVSSTLVGFLIGIVMFILVVLLMRVLTRMQVDGNTDMTQLQGLTGTVYVSIPAQGASGGQVQLTHPNGMLTLPAIQMGDCELPAHTRIVVLESNAQGVLVKSL